MAKYIYIVVDKYRDVVGVSHNQLTALGMLKNIPNAVGHEYIIKAKDGDYDPVNTLPLWDYPPQD